MASIEIEKIKPNIGGVVHVDKADLCEPEIVRKCQEALEDRGVLVFPRIHLTDKEQLAFTDNMGERVNYTRSVPGTSAAEPDVYRVTLDKDINDSPAYVLGTYFWHIDGATTDMPLPKATLLTARKVSSRGGQTEFANTYAAYEDLPEWEKTEIEELRAIHTVESSLRPVFEPPTDEERRRWDSVGARMEHPVVWTHESGRKSLVVGSHADRIVDMPLADGRAILCRLAEWAAQPEFRYTHEWQEGDLAIWDNCGLMHRVYPYDAASGRTMHRTSIAGTEKIA